MTNKKDMETQNLKKLSVKDLKTLLKENKIPYDKKSKKQELINEYVENISKVTLFQAIDSKSNESLIVPRPLNKIIVSYDELKSLCRKGFLVSKPIDNYSNGVPFVVFNDLIIAVYSTDLKYNKISYVNNKIGPNNTWYVESLQ